jgi:TM2 domain-containing membrane protein YozV
MSRFAYGVFLNLGATRCSGARWSQIDFMCAQGSTGNVIAALASFFIPGLGQLLQGRFIKAGIMFVLAAVLWWFLLGWIIHLWSIIDAALFKRPVS